MSANPAQNRAHWLLAVLLLVQVIMMSAYARRPDSEQTILRTWVMTVMTPIVNAASWTIDKVTGTISSYTDLRGAREENIALRQQIERLTAERDQALERAAGYERLRTELALPAAPQYPQLAANVVSRDTSLWYRRLVIDRGALDGVKRDMPVVTVTGIVGRVISVGPNYSVVQVITDKHAGVGAQLQNSRMMGEVRGNGEGGIELKNIPTTTQVQVGENVITTGLDRIYPKGLVVGTVERLENDPNTPWYRIVIKPGAPINNIESVLVLLVEQKDLAREAGMPEDRKTN